MNLKGYNKETKIYITNVCTYLTEKYGVLKPEWESIIFLLADNLELYEKCKESVKKNGIYNVESGKKNPLLSTMKDLQATIIKQIQHLGLSPYAVSKIKDIAEEDENDFIEELTNE